MSGQRLLVEVVKAQGAKHLTKAEIEQRQDSGIKPITDNIIAPAVFNQKAKGRILSNCRRLLS